MKKLLILSGKGGTGKTTVASALIELFGAEAFADCDVDAPNLHLVESRGKEPHADDFYGSKKAVIDRSKCIFCGTCASNCRFDAIKLVKSKYAVDEYACEGCGVCEYVCPAKAIHLEDDMAGKLMLYKDGFTFSTAELKMGRGNSGKLVTAVKKQPSLSGISDMERILETIYRFDVPVAVCINKYDTSAEKAAEIISFCKEHSILFVGAIPFDNEVLKAQNNGTSVIHTDCPASGTLKEIYNKIKNLMTDLKG